MSRRKLLAGSVVLAGALLLAMLIGLAHPSDRAVAQLSTTRSIVPTQPVVARIYYADPTDLQYLSAHLDVWEVDRKAGYVVAALTPVEYLQLVTQGYRVEADAALTAQLNRPVKYLPGQTEGIPDYPCYRTVEETFTTAQNIVAQHPDLAQWIDIGDSWEKSIPGGEPGYDMLVLRLTNLNRLGDKPKFFSMSAVHAREYTTAEINTRFAEYLVNNYGVDPDVTWLLDYTEVHLLLQANPDGRKQAETGLSWRKNTNNAYCANSNSRGADLNRNYPFYWGCCNGSSGSPCDLTYRGPSAGSEPETQAVVNYVRSQYPDLRPDDLNLAAPLTTTGIFMDLHSYSELVLWPWGFTANVAPNGPAMQTLGRKFAYFNNYEPGQSIGLYATDGTTDDFAYGELGLPAYTFEMGTSFFQGCSTFENTIVPANLPALVYAVKATRRPYLTPAGPDVLNATAAPTGTQSGKIITLTATANDTRFNNVTGTEPTQNIAAARYTIDQPAWIAGVTVYPMSAADGSFNSPIENLTSMVSTTGWTSGRHMLFIESQDAAGNWGVPTAVFVWIGPPLDKRLYLPSVMR